jgi:hypothetical protein
VKGRRETGSRRLLAGSSVAVAALICGLLATSPPSAAANCETKEFRYLVTFTHNDRRSVVTNSGSNGVQTVTGTLNRSFVFGVTLESRKCKSGLKTILVKATPGPGQQSNRISGSDPRRSDSWGPCKFDFTATIPEHTLELSGFIQPHKKRWDFSLRTGREDIIYQAEVLARFSEQCPGSRGIEQFFTEDFEGKSVGDLFFAVPNNFYNYISYQVKRADETSANKPPDLIKALYKGQSTVLTADWNVFRGGPSETTYSADVRIAFEAV